MRQVPSLVVTNSRIAAGGRYAALVCEARVPVSASRTALATSSGRAFRSPATVAASTQPRPGRWVPETAYPVVTGETTVAASPSGSGPISIQDSSSRDSGARSPKRTSSPVS